MTSATGPRRGLALTGWVAAFALVGLASTAREAPPSLPPAPAVTVTAEPTTDAPVRTDSPTAPERPDVTFTLAAAGDIVAHPTAMNDGLRLGFATLAADELEIIAGADLALCHLDAPIAPDGTTTSGYPVFGAPRGLAQGIADIGWDGCSLAGNHAVDRGADGIAATIAAFDEAGLGHTGIASTEAESTPQLYEVTVDGRTVTVAHISYTYGLNGLPKPAGQPWAVNTFDADAADVSGILQDAAWARDHGADVVITSIHNGAEYVTEPTAAQLSAAEQIAASGLVDLYIGSHVHVPQPMMLLPGGTAGDGMWAALGMGNWLSDQSRSCCVLASENGYTVQASITLHADGTTTVAPQWTPTTLSRYDEHRVYVLEPGATAGILGTSEVGERYAKVADAVGQDALVLFEPLGGHATATTVVPREG